MLAALIGIVVILLLIGLAVWSSRTKETTGNGSNTDAARRYGSGHGGA